MLKDIAAEHARRGDKLTVYTTTSASDVARRAWAAEHGIELLELELPADRGLSTVRRSLHLLRFLLGLLYILTRRRFDLVIATSNPPVAAAALVRIASQLRGAAYAYYVQDIVPEMLMCSASRASRCVGRVTRWIDGWNVRSAAVTITLSKTMRQTLRSRGCQDASIEVLQNFAVDAPSPEESDDSKTTAIPTLVFAGNHGQLQNLEHFLRSVKIASKSTAFRVLMLGGGSERARLSQVAHEFHLDNVEFAGALPRSEAQRRIAACDAGIVAAAPGLFRVAYPSKLISYALAGLPSLVLTETGSAEGDEIESQGLGVTASPTNPHQAAVAIEKLVGRITCGESTRHDLSRTASWLYSRDAYLHTYFSIPQLSVPSHQGSAMNYSNDRLQFDTSRFDFAKLVLDEINRHQRAIGLQQVEELRQVHKVDGIAQHLEAHRQHLFTLFRTPAFQRLYREFGKQLIDDHFTTEAVIQKTPTVRIQLAGGNSVSFHSDAWYGHGSRVCSFWLPLTTVSGANSLQMARDIDESRQFLSQIAEEQMDLDEINDKAAALCDPVEAAFGDLIVFNGDMVHGTVHNATPTSRVSFDFRIAESVTDIGMKPAANFYTYEQLSTPVSDHACGEIARRPRRRSLMYSGACRGVSAKSQLVFLNEYARINDIDIVGSESEIVVFDYAPVLQKYAKNPPSGIDSVLLFSVDLLPADPDIRRRIYENAIASKVALLFGAEDVCLSDECDIAKVETLVTHPQPAPTLSAA
ncbi:putative glycosyl transferase [Posidoniimonas corsicana]|uniref:Putative glycosyl transferase n=1 Tax=Posidoniimonas corsicana TaxID=1938618 RepID=A0A5C5V8C7_9BACT|nr:glycosyltransferase [Posidoniimonas corsicana]TWT34015.1 putative glycosyl transferase [Posidoniimonas corsicana]